MNRETIEIFIDKFIRQEGYLLTLQGLKNTIIISPPSFTSKRKYNHFKKYKTNHFILTHLT